MRNCFVYNWSSSRILPSPLSKNCLLGGVRVFGRSPGNVAVDLRSQFVCCPDNGSLSVSLTTACFFSQHEFCWVCLGAWDPHGASWYNCNRYNADDAKKARDIQEARRLACEVGRRFQMNCDHLIVFFFTIRDPASCCKGICFIATGTWTTCRACALKTR